MIKVKIKDIVDIFNGSTPSTSVSENFDGHISWITPKDISDQKTKYINRGERNITEKGLNSIGGNLLPKGTILFSSRAPIGLMSICTKETATNQGFKNMVCKKDKIDNEYLFYLLKTQISKIQELGTGTTFKEVSKSTIESFEIYIEENVPTQQKIAAVLSALDDKIEVNNKINAELEAMAKTLYDYWFVQFDFPNEEGKPYKSSGGKMVYNSTLKREIPEGWEVKNLSSFINSDKSGDWGKEEEQGNYIVKVECIRGADINGINGKGDVKSPVRYILEKNNHKLLSENDFVVEISGGSPTQSTGRIACITKEVLQRFENPLICSNFCKAVSLKNEDEVNYFLSTWNRAYDNNILFGFEGKTSGIKNLLFEDFVTAYDIAKPTSDLLKKFNNKISLFEKKRQENLKQNQELAQLRDWLLPMLMNGQVTVGEALEATEKQLAMVAEPSVDYKIKDDIKENRFALWLSNQKLAARGDIDEVVLREIFDAMDDEDQ
ncbi:MULTISPECIES: restriction endonuclease subunit S [unclassified Empedobacter]|uniref:restriction endonuclease subunit S n=1 Tax=unclassified Empedobacter TaxID=2643773 RepID=UPI0025B9D2EA|nr:MULTISPECIES: restriction endonuclease subunit S [unclassified Empedobacter]